MKWCVIHPLEVPQSKAGRCTGRLDWRCKESGGRPATGMVEIGATTILNRQQIQFAWNVQAQRFMFANSAHPWCHRNDIVCITGKTPHVTPTQFCQIGPHQSKHTFFFLKLHLPNSKCATRVASRMNEADSLRNAATISTFIVIISAQHMTKSHALCVKQKCA